MLKIEFSKVRNVQKPGRQQENKTQHGNSTCQIHEQTPIDDPDDVISGYQNQSSSRSGSLLLSFLIIRRRVTNKSINQAMRAQKHQPCSSVSTGAQTCLWDCESTWFFISKAEMVTLETADETGDIKQRHPWSCAWISFWISWRLRRAPLQMIGLTLP